MRSEQLPLPRYGTFVICCPSLFERNEVTKMKDWRERISIDPSVCHGKPCIEGTRIWISLIVDNLAAGATDDEMARRISISRKRRY